MPLQMFRDQPKHPLDRIGSIIAIAAGKGGVGKSSVTVNLALALKNRGYSVGVMDTDIYGPSIRRMLPEDRMPQQRGDTIIPALSFGIRMISMAYFRKEEEASVVRAPIANNVVSQFIRQVEWGDLDYLLIDFPPGTGDIQLTLAQQAKLTGAVMVTTPQEVALMDVRKAMHMFDQVNVPIAGVIENMSYFDHAGERLHIFGRGGGERLAREVGVPVLGSIPIDPEVCRSGDHGLSLFHRPDGVVSSTAEAFLAAADAVVDHVAALGAGTPSGFELEWQEMGS